jgi:(+)-trans-carveol dehydrogenase
MIMNDETMKIFVPGNPHPTREDFAVASQAMNALPIPWVEPIDISKALVFLAPTTPATSPASRFRSTPGAS